MPGVGDPARFVAGTIEQLGIGECARLEESLTALDEAARRENVRVTEYETAARLSGRPMEAEA